MQIRNLSNKPWKGKAMDFAEDLIEQLKMRLPLFPKKDECDGVDVDSDDELTTRKARRSLDGT